MNPEHSYILPTDANVTTVSELCMTVKNSALLYFIQNVEMYILGIDFFNSKLILRSFLGKKNAVLIS